MPSTTPTRPLKAKTCEASGRWAPANADGRATCPLCESTWHVRTKDGRLRAHVRKWPRPFTREEFFARLQGMQR